MIEEARLERTEVTSQNAGATMPEDCHHDARILLDVNILVYAHREDTERHGEFEAWLEIAFKQPSGAAVSELVLSHPPGPREEGPFPGPTLSLPHPNRKSVPRRT